MSVSTLPRCLVFSILYRILEVVPTNHFEKGTYFGLSFRILATNKNVYGLGSFYIFVPYVSPFHYSELFSLFFFEVSEWDFFKSGYSTDCFLNFVDNISTVYSIFSWVYLLICFGLFNRYLFYSYILSLFLIFFHCLSLRLRLITLLIWLFKESLQVVVWSNPSIFLVTRTSVNFSLLVLFTSFSLELPDYPVTVPLVTFVYLVYFSSLCLSLSLQ